MKTEGLFVAEKVAAQHCEELLRNRQQTVNALKELARLGERIAEPLARDMAGLCAGQKVRVDVRDAVELAAGSNSDKRSDPMLHSMIAIGSREVMMVASLPQRAILSLVDIALGGNGKDCEPPAGKLPVSAQMMFGRFEKLVAAVLAEALALPDGELVKPKRDGVAETDTPFAGFKRTMLPVAIGIGEAEVWELNFLFPGSAVAKLFAASSAKQQAALSDGAPKRPDPRSEPYGGIKLPLTAVLVDMPVRLSTLSRLKPGMVIPVSVARNVPLFAGEEMIARGSVGEMDDRVALQLNQIITDKEI